MAAAAANTGHTQHKQCASRTPFPIHATQQWPSKPIFATNAADAADAPYALAASATNADTVAAANDANADATAKEIL